MKKYHHRPGLAELVADSFLHEELARAVDQVTGYPKGLILSFLRGDSVEVITRAESSHPDDVEYWLEEAIRQLRTPELRSAFAAYLYGAPPPVDRICPGCGVLLARPLVGKRGRPKLYCSSRCRKRGHYSRKRENQIE
ncbi:hypothetical protein ACW9HQ_48135 [Nocardia gipuzkoensis]